MDLGWTILDPPAHGASAQSCPRSIGAILPTEHRRNPARGASAQSCPRSIGAILPAEHRRNPAHTAWERPNIPALSTAWERPSIPAGAVDKPQINNLYSTS